MHRQETVDCLKKFNARRKLKVTLSKLAAKCTIRSLEGLFYGWEMTGGWLWAVAWGSQAFGDPHCEEGERD